MESLEGKVALVTGAGRGLGRQMALRFSREGARVVLVSRTEADLTEVSETAQNETLVAPADVSDHAAVESVVADTLEVFGRIDVLVNNAAIAQTHLSDRLKRTGDVTRTEWETILSVDLSGPFYLAAAVLPAFVEQGAGNVVNVSSNAGSHPFHRCTPYVASKHGLDGLTKQLALEYGDDGVNANGLYPDGAVPTSFQQGNPDVSDDDLESMADTDVLNDAAVLLASQEPGGVTGETLPWHEWETRLDT